MFKRIARGRGNLFQNLTSSLFESVSSEHFEILRVLHLTDSDRSLYLMRKK
jgi:hypothetical protein